MNRKKKTSIAGFTLIEILVTTAIIGILVGIVLGIAGMAGRKSDESKTRAEMQKISNAIEQYRLVYGAVPPTKNGYSATDGLKEILLSETDIPSEYKEFKLQDPWGRDYQYEKISRYGYTLMSTGPKGPSDTSDNIKSGSY